MAKPIGPLCNLACDYCYYLGKTSLFPAGERYRMSDGVLEAHVRSFIEASPGPLVCFAWHGGEPTLAGLAFYRRVVELQRRHLPSGWRCINNLQTNGTRLDDGWCAFLAEHGFAVGLSVDGPGPVPRPQPARPPGEPDPRQGDAGPGSAARPRRRAGRALHPQRAHRGGAARGVSLLPRRGGALGAVPPRRGAGGGWRCHRAVGRAGDHGQLPLHHLRRVGPPRRGSNRGPELRRGAPGGERDPRQPLRDVRDLRPGAGSRTRRRRLRLRPLRRPKSPAGERRPRRPGRAGRLAGAGRLR